MKTFLSCGILFLFIVVLNEVSQAQNVSISDAWWTDLVDQDLDGYTRSRTLNFSATSDQNVSVVLRIYAFLDGGSPLQYYQSGPFALFSGTFSYSQPGIGTSSTGGELPNGTYDFIVQLRRASDPSVILAQRNSSDADLNNELFETAAGDTPVNPPTLSSPANGASNQPSSINYVWEASAGATSYCLQVSSDAGFSSLFFNECGIASTSRQVTNHCTNQTYYWRVSATNGANTSDWSQSRSLTTAKTSAPSLLDPPSGAERIGPDITFTWLRSTGASEYYLQINVSSSFGSPHHFDGSVGNDSSRVVGNFPGNHTTFYWRVRARNCGGWGDFSAPTAFNNTAEVHDIGLGMPTTYELSENYPNPFNPSTTIRFALPTTGLVSLKLFDQLGREVKTLVDEAQPAGFKSVEWNSTNNAGQPVASGVYFYRLQAGEFVQTKKLLLLR